MNKLNSILILILVFIAASCSNENPEEKGFQISTTSESSETDRTNELKNDSLKFDTRPSGVLITGIPNVRLTTVYKVNINKRTKKTYTGSNGFHYRYEEDDENKGNNWHNNLMPGFEAVYGYNLVNISQYAIQENKQTNFFENPVLIKTLYYPTFSKDTLNKKPVKRNYCMVSVYDVDTNKDGFIDLKDLRRFYLFNINGEKQKALIPENYSVFKSEYDSENDFMYVFGQLDENGNGRIEEREPTHIFWIDLKDPTKTGRLY